MFEFSSSPYVYSFLFLIYLFVYDYSTVSHAKSTVCVRKLTGHHASAGLAILSAVLWPRAAHSHLPGERSFLEIPLAAQQTTA